MKKAIMVICLMGTGLSLQSQHKHFSHDDAFTRAYMHGHYTPSYEFGLFALGWNNLINNYLATVSFSNRISSVSSFDFPVNDPEELLSQYFMKIKQLNSTFSLQQEANNAMIDQGIRGLGELAADVAMDNNLTTNDPLADFLIKEIAIGAVQERTKQKNAEKLETQRIELQRNLESNLSIEMSSIRDQMLSENMELKDKYLEAMAYETDFLKESYYVSCYDYHDCFLKQIKSEYTFKSSNWYKPKCKTPKEDYATSIKNDYLNIAFRKLDLYRKYNNEIFKDATNIFLDASLSENKQNPRAYFLKAQLEKDILSRMFFSNLAVTLDPGNTEYKSQLGEMTYSFNVDFFNAIRNDDADFISRSIEKGFQLGLIPFSSAV